MSDDIVERVAVAMRIAYARLNHDEPPIPFDKSRARDEWLCCARAAIEALHEPTEAMFEAGYDATRLSDGTPQFADAGFCIGHAGKIFSAMVSAALQPATDSEAQS